MQGYVAKMSEIEVDLNMIDGHFVLRRWIVDVGDCKRNLPDGENAPIRPQLLKLIRLMSEWSETGSLNGTPDYREKIGHSFRTSAPKWASKYFCSNALAMQLVDDKKADLFDCDITPRESMSVKGWDENGQPYNTSQLNEKIDEVLKDHDAARRKRSEVLSDAARAYSRVLAQRWMHIDSAESEEILHAAGKAYWVSAVSNVASLIGRKILDEGGLIRSVLDELEEQSIGNFHQYNAFDTKLALSRGYLDVLQSYDREMFEHLQLDRKQLVNGMRQVERALLSLRDGLNGENRELPDEIATNVVSELQLAEKELVAFNSSLRSELTKCQEQFLKLLKKGRRKTKAKTKPN